MPTDPVTVLLKELAAGQGRALARAITLAEQQGPATDALLQRLPGGNAPVIGITGPPGAGKSSLTNALLGEWTRQGLRIGVLAIDPSSPFHFGALLGDRIRMSDWFTHPKVFIRSLASRGALGGLHPRILEVADVMRSARFDKILIETVGVGQSEVDIAGLADCTIVTLVPEAGDVVQTMKAGLMEVADLFVVNKADRPGAEALWRNLRIMAHEQASVQGTPETPVLRTIASTGEGAGALADAIDQYLAQPVAKQRKLMLLARRSMEIIRNLRTADIAPQVLKAALAAALAQPDFNLYRFSSDYAGRSQAV